MQREIVTKIAAEYNNGWIPVEKRLPEPGSYVLVSLGGGSHPEKVHFSEHGEWEYLIIGKGYVPLERFKWKVIAWQPLPEPYSVKSNPSEQVKRERIIK